MCMSLEAISVAFLFPRGGEQCRKRYAPMVQDKRLACSMCGSVADGAQLLRLVNCPHHEDFIEKGAICRAAAAGISAAHFSVFSQFLASSTTLWARIPLRLSKFRVRIFCEGVHRYIWVLHMYCTLCRSIRTLKYIVTNDPRFL